MNTLSEYHVVLTLQSAMITPLQSDTLFGHIAWAIRYVYDEKRLVDLLNNYKVGEIPPLMVSDGFPLNELPRPFLKPLMQDVVEVEIEKAAKENRVLLDSDKRTKLQKKLKGQNLLCLEKLKAIQGQLTSQNLLRVLLDSLDWDELRDTKGDVRKKEFKASETSVVYHNTVNRLLGKVTQGLYQQAETYFNTKSDANKFDVYVRTNAFTKDELEKIFQFIGYSGFGRDKSTGKGHFTIEIEDGYGLPEVENPNAFMTLAHYVPNDAAPTKGFYRLMTKYGRLGGDFAKSAIRSGESHNPFKKPILMIQPGSVFLGTPDNNYGCLLSNIHKNAIIRHYAYAFPLGVKVDEEEFNL